MPPPHRPPPLLYIVTDRSATGGRPLADVVDAALRGGPADRIAVQLRERDLEGRALLELAHRLREVTARRGAHFLVNDRVDVALACEADGVHLGRASLSVSQARSLAPGLTIALSTHAPAGVAACAGARSTAADFYVLGPVFDTPSKRAFGSALGLETLGQAARLGSPILAIGGVDAENAGACIRAGAAGIACIRAVMAAPDPEAAVRRLMHAVT